VTFFEEGQGSMLAEVEAVRAHYAASSGLGGFAIHRYREPYLGGSVAWPERNAAWLSLPAVPALGRGGRLASRRSCHGNPIAEGRDSSGTRACS
jgi:hypothetical protein